MASYVWEDRLDQETIESWSSQLIYDNLAIPNQRKVAENVLPGQVNEDGSVLDRLLLRLLEHCGMHMT